MSKIMEICHCNERNVSFSLIALLAITYDSFVPKAASEITLSLPCRSETRVHSSEPADVVGEPNRTAEPAKAGNQKEALDV
ncbi:hypothetical protein BBB56_21585 [Candidatus Pantoea deserta]|uniref:Uncharacterized protein n=1 Tax=Candidatus Pantoea deserta TaxID=1869313 RepID=A0A3N4NRQ9_9GAMM|nr:hypothetical protein BBB56_21585 [Pantoea deserta]